MGIREDRPDCTHCRFEPLRNVSIDRLQRADACGGCVKISSEPRTVCGECMQLAGEGLLSQIRGLPPLDGRRQRIKRERKTLAGSLDRTWFAHCGKNSTERPQRRQLKFIAAASG